MNNINIQKLEDGARNHIVKIAAVLDQGDISPAAALTVFDPALNYIDQAAPTDSAAIDEVEFTIQDGIDVFLWWDAPVPVLVMPLTGRSKMIWNQIYNNAGPGTSGKLLLSTVGASPGQVFAFTVEITLHKTRITITQ